MSTSLIQDLHGGISRRDWAAVEAAANRLRDEIDQTIRILAGPAIGSMPNDYPLSKLAAEATEGGAHGKGDWRQDDKALIARLRDLVDNQSGGDAVILVQRQLFNKAVGRLAALTNTSGDDEAPVADEINTLKEEIARLEDELHDALQTPWPEWAEKIIKLVRSYSGYDGYDDATDGVDVVGEVEEALSELYSEAERLRTARPQSAAVRGEAPDMLMLAVSAVLEADKEFRDNMPKGWDGDPLSDEIDGLRRVFSALHSTQEG